MNKQSASRKIVTGEWDGETIWRYETAKEVLANALHEEQKKKVINFDAKQLQMASMNNNYQSFKN